MTWADAQTTNSTRARRLTGPTKTIMKTIHPITVIVQPRYAWGPESRSYTYAIRAGAFRSVSSYQVGDILVAGSNAKRVLGKVYSVTGGEHEEVVITPLLDNEEVDDIGTSAKELIPERFITGLITLREEYRPAYPKGYGFAPRRWFATLDGAYQSVLANSDVAVRLQGPERVYTSLQEEPLTWEAYHAMRRRQAEEARADEIREAILCLRNIVRDCPHMLERVYPVDSDKAIWKFGGIPLIDHDEEDPFLSALEDILYSAAQ